MKENLKKILHVEDDKDIQQYIATVLSDSAEITPVSTIKAAKAALSNNTYKLVIVDLILPDGSGTGLVLDLAEQYPSLPVIVFSSHEITDTMRNVSRVFVKGRFRNQELIDTVHKLC